MWKSKGLSDKSIKSPVASNNSLYSNTKIRVKLDDRCLKQEKVTFKHKQLVNIYIFYEISGHLMSASILH